MKSIRPIFWHQGLFLQPQHFQLSDQAAQAPIRPLLDTTLPYGWGVRQVDIQSSALTRGTAHVNEIALLFQDGTYVQFPGNAVVIPRSFEKDWTAREKPLTIYAGLRRFKENDRNVTIVPHLDTEGVETRFLSLSDPEEYPDLYGDGPVAPVKTLYYNIRLFWEEEIEGLNHYNLIPVGQVLWDSGVIKVSSSFIPPSLSLSSSRTLTSLVSEIRNECASRARQLEEFKSPRDAKGEGLDASYMVYMLALRTLNRYVPLLYHYSESDPIHPWLLYGTLRQMVGELSTFSDRVNLLGETDTSDALPAYDHQNIWGCLSRVQESLFTLLNDLTVGPDLLVRLEPNDDSFEAVLSPGFFSPRTRYYLVVKMEEDPDASRTAFIENTKLGPPSLMSTLIRRALPGVELTPMSAPPQGLPRRLNALYFRIETRDSVWEAIRQEEAIGLFWPGAPGGVAIDLIGVR